MKMKGIGPRGSRQYPLSFSNESVLEFIVLKMIALDQGKNVNISIVLLLWAVNGQRNITINCLLFFPDEWSKRYLIASF